MTTKHASSQRTLTRRQALQFSGLAALGVAAASSLFGCAQPKSASSKTAAAQTTSWREKPEPITSIARTLDADVVVIGAGNAGLVGAMTAAEAGMNVIVLEKGGEIAMAREAIGTYGSRHSAGHEPNLARLMNHARDVSGGDVNMALYRAWAEHSGEFMDWLEDLEAPAGMTFPFEYHAPSDEAAYYPAMCTNPIMGEHNPDGQNYGAYAHLKVLRDLFLEAGGQIAFSTPAKQLVQDESGRVTGVIAYDNSNKSYLQVNASKGIIMCTGGYGANKDMINDLCPDALAYCTSSAATTEEGDGIRMALWAGGVLEKGAGAMVWNRGVVDDSEELGPDKALPLFLPASQPFLRVNVQGERFMNEDSTYPEVYSQGTRQPKGFSWQVFDGTFWEDIQRFDTCGCSRLTPAPDGSAFNSDVYDCEALTKAHIEEFWMAPLLESGILKKCDTLEELARTMFDDDSSQQTFLETVKHYNALNGVDTDFGKATYRMSTVDTAPFFAIRTAGNFLVTINGIITDTKSRVLREDGTVIPGLYVCGNDQGGFYPHNYPSEFTGINAGRSATFARIAAKDICGIA